MVVVMRSSYSVPSHKCCPLPYQPLHQLLVSNLAAVNVVGNLCQLRAGRQAQGGTAHTQQHMCTNPSTHGVPAQ